jgi:subtilisin family serine protease
VVASSLSRQSGRGGAYFPYPYESIDYTPTTTGTYYIVVKKVNSSQPNRALTLFSTGPDLVTRTTASSILQPADCAKVIGVGAVNFSNDNAETYSSEGPTTDGRAKPEIAAPDGTKTSLSGAFWGTSAASPHATGAAALLLANNPTMTPAQLRAALPAAVKDVNTTGFDYRTGSGRISLDADGDGLNHDLELSYGTSPTLADTDGDGLTDSQEIQLYGTSPTLADTDGDGLTDGQEVLVYSTNPNQSNKGDLAPRSHPDGVVNVADLLILTRFVENLDPPSPQELTLADANNDGVLDVRDILQMRQQLGY